MAATISVFKTGSEGDFRYVLLDVTGDSSYATGGYDISTPINSFLPAGHLYSCDSPSNGTHWGILDTTNKKLVFRLQTTGAEVANAVNVSTSTVRIKIVGK